MKDEKLVTDALTVFVSNTAFLTRPHSSCALVLYNPGVRAAVTMAGSKGMVTVTGCANVVPCGVKTYAGPFEV